jgi:tRNA-binding EMAP/Myf-like protein
MSRTVANLLRTHTSPMQIRHAVQHVKKYRARIDAGQGMPEIRVIAPGRTYRVDSDATHSPMFHQCEGLWIGENVSFKDLKWSSPIFAVPSSKATTWCCASAPASSRSPSPAPRSTSSSRAAHWRASWLEVAGSGQVHPNVVRNMGLDPEHYIGFAFGMGPDRLTMLRYGVNDLRLFFDGDIRFPVASSSNKRREQKVRPCNSQNPGCANSATRPHHRQLADTLTMAGLEVEELKPCGATFTGIVVGEIKEAVQHPDADRLRVCQVDAGQGALLNIVCGAPNARVGIKVPCALVGAELPPGEDGKPFLIKVGKLRGVESQGMLCSASRTQAVGRPRRPA